MKNANDMAVASQESDAVADLEELWRIFTRAYPTDQACLKAIVKGLRDEGGVVCPGCGARDFKVKQARNGRCKCQSRFSITAGTFFDRMKSPKAWHAAIWLMSRGATLNATAFSKKVMIAPSTGRSILQRVMAVIHGQKDNKLMNSRSASFMPLFVRRSAETEARAHPRSEEEAVQKKTTQARNEPSSTCDVNNGNEETSKAAEVATCELANREEAALPTPTEFSDDTASILRLLTNNPKSISELCNESGLPILTVQTSMTMLELDGVCRRVRGGNFTRAAEREAGGQQFDQITDLKYACGPETRAAQREAIKYISSTFRGISRKYLQLYLSAHWCFVDRKRWSEGALFKACIAHRPIREADIFAMITDPVVWFASGRQLDVAI